MIGIDGPRSGARGHRAIDHTADVILEAWGPTFASCCEEAVAALAETYVQRTPVDLHGIDTTRLAPVGRGQQLLGVLDEVLYVLDTNSAVPVGVRVVELGDGSLDVTVLLADRSAVVSTGAVPKAIARSEFSVTAGPGGAFRCSFLVDL